jgi:excisionase family DNA binding protein
MEKMLTVAEAADALHVSENTIRALCSARKLRHERYGMGRGTIRIPPDAIAEYRERVTVQTDEGRSKPPPPRRQKRLRNLSLD